MRDAECVERVVRGGETVAEVWQARFFKRAEPACYTHSIGRPKERSKVVHATDGGARHYNPAAVQIHDDARNDTAGYHNNTSTVIPGIYLLEANTGTALIGL